MKQSVYIKSKSDLFKPKVDSLVLKISTVRASIKGKQDVLLKCSVKVKYPAYHRFIASV